jgi:multiple sugar transport system permease protein
MDRRSTSQLAEESGGGIAGLGRLAAYAVLTSGTVTCLFPVYWIAITSIKMSEFGLDGSTFLPGNDFTPTLESWRLVLFDSHDHTLARTATSLVAAGTATAACLSLGALAAYSLTRLQATLPFALQTTLLP